MLAARVEREPDRGGARGPLLVAAAAVLFGTTGLFVVNLAHLPLLAVLGMRFGFGALAFAALLAATHAGRAGFAPPRGAWPHLAGMGVAMALVDLCLYASILGGAGVALATLLLYTAPVWVALGSAVLLRERPTRAAGIGIALGFAGALAILRPGLAPAGLAVLLGLASGLAWAAWLLLSRRAGERGASGESQALASMLVGALALAPLALLRGDLATVAPRDALLALALAVLAGALPLWLTARGLKILDAARAAVLGYLEPATAVVIGAVVFREGFGAFEALGSALVVAGALVVTLSGLRRS